MTASYAGFWRRFGAGLIDGLVLAPLLWMSLAASTRETIAIVEVVVLLLSFAYTIGLHTAFGATAGKMVMGIQVRRTDGHEISASEAWLRSSVDLVLSGATIVGTLIALYRIAPAALATLDTTARTELLSANEPLWSTWALNLYMVWICSEVVVMLTNRRRRALHDFLAGTVVVRKAPAVPAAG